MSNNHHFEVKATTQLGDEVGLGKACTVVDACQLIESVDESQYQPAEYTIKKVVQNG